MRSVLGDLGRFAGDLALSMRRIAAHGLLEVFAIELAARIVGTLLVAVAGLVGASSAVGGLALTALVALTRMVAMVLQILVLLRAMRSVPSPPTGDARVRAALAGLAASVLPAFLLLTAWGAFQSDVREYALTALASLDLSNGTAPNTVLDVPVDVLTVSLLVVCLVLRGVLRRFERRGTGRAVSAAALVLEGLWTFLAVAILGRVVGVLGDWFAGTRLASGIDQVRAAIDAVVGGVLLDAWMLLGEVWHVVTLPLVWLTLAGIVLLGARPELAPQSTEPARPARWWSRLVEVLPTPLDDAVEEITDDLHDRWVPVIATLRQVWRAGLPSLAAGVVAWYVVHVACGWLTVALTHALWVQPDTLAQAVANVGSAIGDSIAAVLGLVVSVASLDALRLGVARIGAAPPVPQSGSGTPIHGYEPPISSRASEISPPGSTNAMPPESDPVSS